MALLTTGAIAEKLNVDRDRVSYAVRKLAIKPVGVAGQVRVFSEKTPLKIKKFLVSKRAKVST